MKGFWPSDGSRRFSFQPPESTRHCDVYKVTTSNPHKTAKDVNVRMNPKNMRTLPFIGADGTNTNARDLFLVGWCRLWVG